MSQSRHHLFLALPSVAMLLLTASAVAANNTLKRRSAIGGDQTLVSPGNIFQLGLFSVANNTKWFLGIWFTVSTEAVIWVANRDRPLNASSSGFLSLSGQGDLVLLDAASNNETVWSSNSSSSATAVAQLDDTGNLVLADDAGSVLWQSFEHPTNTFVPDMRIGKSIKTGDEWSLSSWRDGDDPSAGDFRFVMDTQGSPEFHAWSRKQGRKTYRTGPWNGVRFSGIPEMGTYKGMFEFQFTDTAHEVSYMYHAYPGSPPSRVVLDESGVVHRMVWDRTLGKWSVFWSGPRDQCDTYGMCGAFGVCNVVDAVVCDCIRGFRQRSPAEWRMRNPSGGCVRSTPLQCERGGEDGFYALRGVKLPETHGSSVDNGTSLEECRRRCLANCSCTAYAASDIRGGGSGCIQWFGELMDTRFLNGGQDLFVRLAMSDLDISAIPSQLTLQYRN
uniref:non-specific serine/threonine protein kinase n=1 Tax=Hordeum vulgare subsp. vulgare TaxID=112509 RepID=A0A8I6X0T5_HORVV